MGANSKIEWTVHTFNPWVGCTKVSPACDFCYAESWAKRTGHPELWYGKRRMTSPENWKQPVKWNKAAQRLGIPQTVFGPSLADPFDNQVPPEWRANYFKLIRDTPWLIYLLLTKRPQNIIDMVDRAGGRLPRNVALGTTIEDQKRANINGTALLDATYVLKPLFSFASCEPLLEEIDMRRLVAKIPGEDSHHYVDALNGDVFDDIEGTITGAYDPGTAPKLDWIICGGESGHYARSLPPRGALRLADDCTDTGTAFFMKQLSARSGKGFKDFDNFPTALRRREFPQAMMDYHP